MCCRSAALAPDVEPSAYRQTAANETVGLWFHGRKKKAQLMRPCDINAAITDVIAVRASSSIVVPPEGLGTAASLSPRTDWPPMRSPAHDRRPAPQELPSTGAAARPPCPKPSFPPLAGRSAIRPEGELGVVRAQRRDRPVLRSSTGRRPHSEAGSTRAHPRWPDFPDRPARTPRTKPPAHPISIPPCHSLLALRTHIPSAGRARPLPSFPRKRKTRFLLFPQARGARRVCTPAATLLCL
jgi:hypothetical protein